MTDEVLGEYEVMRRHRIQENRQMLASLALPILPRVLSRPQAPKAAVKLEPTRRSSRQRTRRETFKQHKMGETHQVAIIAAAKQQLKRKQKQEQELKAQESARKKQQKIEAREFERLQKSKQRDLEIQVAERKQQQVLETRKRQMERHQQYELPPEKIAKRNAAIQKLIQEELDKQACLAREQNQWELEHQRSRHEQMWKQDEVQKELATTGFVEENETGGITDEFAEAALVMGELEYELVL